MSIDNTSEYEEPMREYCASFFNYIANTQQLCFIKAINIQEAYSVALMYIQNYIKKDAVLEDIDLITEIKDTTFTDYRKEYKRYMHIYNEAPKLPSLLYSEEDGWYYVDSKGSKIEL